MKRENLARLKLRQLSLPYPGGDALPIRTHNGLRSLFEKLNAPESLAAMTDEEGAAMDWLQMWVDAREL